MKARLLTGIAIAIMAVATGVQAGTASAAEIKICGQIKHGPRTTYISTALHKKLSGSTWTVFATGVPCSLAMSNARPILRWFAKAKVGATDYRANGFGAPRRRTATGNPDASGATTRTERPTPTSCWR